MYIHVRNQNDNATYATTRWVPIVRHFLACEDVAGGSQQPGGRIIFLPGRFSLRAKMYLVGPSIQGGIIIFMKHGGLSGESMLSGGGIIILRVIRRHFLAAALDLGVSLSTYSPRAMEAVP